MSPPKPFTEDLRYEYPLTKDSLVIDVGGYEGNFAAGIHEKYKCKVRIYEPVPRFAKAIAQRFISNPHICVFENGLARVGGKRTFHIANDSTGAFRTEGEEVGVSVLDAAAEIAHIMQPIDLLKLNCEGAEFEIIGALLDWNLMKKIRNLQVQWHNVFESAEKEYEYLRVELAQTHHLTYCTPWVWENWELNA